MLFHCKIFRGEAVDSLHEHDQYQHHISSIILRSLVVIAALFKSAWFKGVMGEAIVNLASGVFLNKNDYHVIKNATIPTEDGNQFWGCSTFPKCRAIAETG